MRIKSVNSSEKIAQMLQAGLVRSGRKNVDLAFDGWEREENCVGGKEQTGTLREGKRGLHF